MSDNQFSRQAKPIKGAEAAKQPRAHAHKKAGARARMANPQRVDLMRRHEITTRKNKENQ